MKKFYLISMMVAIGLLSLAQQVPIPLNNVMAPYYNSSRDIVLPFMQAPNNYVHSVAAYNETVLGTTYWDLQSSNSAPPNRFYVYEGGTMAAVWTMGMGTGDSYLDRGTGYAFFDGSSWSAMPTQRIETQRTGWPSYAPAGTGEIIAAHHNSMGIVINHRPTRGTGDWIEYLLGNPDPSLVLSWPRLVSNGTDKSTVHMLVNTYNAYNGLDPAILYYRSTDAGLTWETQARIIEGMTSTDFYGLRSETYAWAEPMGNNLAFVVADRWNDLFIMKSTDNGNTWQKITVWTHPYPMWNGTATEAFYSPDGGASLAFDNDGQLHLVFSINRTQMMQGATNASWFPFVDGIAYWKEGMPTWNDGSMTALHPSALQESGNLVGWVQDLNEDGQINLVGNSASNLGNYFVGMSAMPQLTIDDQNRLFLVYSGIAEGFDNGTQMFRHLFARSSIDNGETWTPVIHLTDSAQNLTENVFPTLAPWSDENIHLIFQVDEEPGLSTQGEFDDPTVNSIVYMQVPKSVMVSTSSIENHGFSVSQNYPNPFKGITTFTFSLEKATNVSLNIYDITGKLMKQVPEKLYNSGNHMLQINAYDLAEGIYTYTFIFNGQTISNKLIVK